MRIMVKAKVAGTKVPREDNSRRYIGDEPVPVARSAYYIRRIRDEDLVMLEGEEAKAALEKHDAARKEEAEKEKAAIAEASKAKASDAAKKSDATTTKGKE